MFYLSFIRRKWLYPALVIGAGCLIVGLVGFFASTSPAVASMLGNASAPAPAEEMHWARVDIAKPTIPAGARAFAPDMVNTPRTASPEAPASTPSDLPTPTATEALTIAPEATETPGILSMEIVPDTPTSEAVPSSEEQAIYPEKGNSERWIDVDLSEQRVYAYEGDVIVNSFLVSTGLPETPTVTGKFKIWIKVRIQDMSGPGYYLKDVPYVMYFYEDYGLHGTYWHNNFGQPMSRGCVNLRIPDAEWLYNWASVGTVVNVHD